MLKYLLGIVLGMAIVLTGAFIFSQKNDANVKIRTQPEYLSAFNSPGTIEQEGHAENNPDMTEINSRTEDSHADTFQDEQDKENDNQSDDVTDTDMTAMDEDHDDMLKPVTIKWGYAKSFNRRNQAEIFAEMMSSDSRIALGVFDMGFAKYMVGFRLNQDQSLDQALEEINRPKGRPNPLIMLKEDFQLLENN